VLRFSGHLSEEPNLDQTADFRRTLKKMTWAMGPYLALTVVAWLLVLFSNDINWPEYVISIGLLILGLGGGLVVSACGYRHWGNVVGIAIALSALGFLREASGGVSAGVSAIAYLVVLQTAINSRSRNELIAVLVLFSAYLIVPIVLIGAPDYPSFEYRSALLSIAIAAGIGFVVQELVSETLERTHKLRFENRLFMSVRETVQRLFESETARDDICRALMTVTGAILVQIYEFDPDARTLKCTACNREIAPEALGWVPRDDGPIMQTFRNAERLILSGDASEHVGDNPIWRAGGEPSSLLFEPMLDFGLAAGILVVGWPGVVEANDARVTAATLLAHEAAAVIRRADQVDLLVDEADTDPLTMLPNRRAWDAATAAATGGTRRFAVAILDLDHFKDYNDRHGHLAGDALLRDTAAAWRSVLRPEDLLARVGGEEFALLIKTPANTDDPPGLDDDGYRQIVERMRTATPAMITCSAGVAVRRSHESAEEVLARADDALYEAKGSGRDQLVSSGI
jgi:diguanylate cyclase (GGDEF)-like protein